jgi:hypothetical protein
MSDLRGIVADILRGQWDEHEDEEALATVILAAVAPAIRRAALEEAAGVACPFSDTRARTGWEAAMRTIRALDAGEPRT